MSTITVGVDLAKNLFSVCEVDVGGRVLRRQDLRHEAFAVLAGPGAGGHGGGDGGVQWCAPLGAAVS